MAGPQADVQALRAKLATLPAEHQTVFALVCAERLVARSAAASDVAVREALIAGWTAVSGEPVDLAGARAAVQARDDLERDEIAVVFYALGAASGRIDDAWWTALRALDKAFDEADDRPGRKLFRRRATSEPTERVLDELHWQDEALNLLAREGTTDELVARLRQ